MTRLINYWGIAHRALPQQKVDNWFNPNQSLDSNSYKSLLRVVCFRSFKGITAISRLI